jgi:hypothetical protein
MKRLPLFKPNKIIEDLDKILAILGVVVGLILILILVFLLPKTAYKYIEAPIMLFFASTIYLFIRERIYKTAGLSHLEELHGNRPTTLILNILFIILFSYSIFSVAARPEFYSRPLGFFISTSLMAAVLAIEILFLPEKKNYTGFILLKIMLIAALLIVTPRLLFPDLIGIDPHGHRWFTMNILEQHYIPEGWAYSKLPVMHLVIGFTSLITNLDYKTSTTLSICFFQVICLIFIFLTGKLVYSPKVGLLAALSLAIASHFIRMGFSVRPITLGVVLISFLIYMLFRKGNNTLLASLTLIMFAVLLLTHTVASLCMAFFLFSFWFSFELYKKMYHGKFEIPVTTLTLSILFTVAMFGWWMYASGHITTFANLINWGLEMGSLEPSETTLTFSKRYELEYMLNTFGLNFYCFFAIIGSLCMFSKKFGNKYSFTLVHGGVMMIAIVFFSLLLGKTGLVAPRWFPGLELILAVPVAIGLLFICGFFKNGLYKVLVLSILILFLSFFMITPPSANVDTPIYSENTMVRYSLTTSELQAANTISSMYNGEIKMDYFYSCCFSGVNVTVSDLRPNFVSGDYADLDGLILIRKEIVERPFFNKRGCFKIYHNPKEKLNNLYFNHIHNSGSVNAFLKETKSRNV